MIRALAPDPFDAPLADRQSIDVLINVWNEHGGNISLAKAESLSVVDPVADEAFARSRAYGELLHASLVRTDDMLARAECCGVAKVFCVCNIMGGHHG